MSDLKPRDLGNDDFAIRTKGAKLTTAKIYLAQDLDSTVGLEVTERFANRLLEICGWHKARRKK